MRARAWRGAVAVVAVAVATVAVPTPAPGGAQLLGAPPGAPLLLAPDNGATFGQLDVQVFAINAVDPEGEPYSGLVTIRNAAGTPVRVLTTHPAPSGVRSTGSPAPPLTEGTYTWSARAVDATGSVGPVSGTRSFRVEGPSGAGGGALAGTVSYGGAGLSHGSCAPTSFSATTTSAATVVNLAVVAYAGPLTITMSGSSGCDSASLGSGAVTVAASGTGPSGSTLGCGALHGSYRRATGVLVADVQGTCTINGFPAGGIRLVVAIATASTTPGGGVTRPISSATCAGGFTVVPS